VKDFFSPFDGSKVNYSGKVIDSFYNVPVESAYVHIIDQNIVLLTDKNGEFSIADLGTGNHRFQINKQKYLKHDEIVSVYLNNGSKTWYLKRDNSFPVLYEFSMIPDSIKAIDNLCRFIISASDTSDYIEKVLIVKDTETIYSKTFKKHRAEDTIWYQFKRAGRSTIYCKVIGNLNDTICDTLIVNVPDNHTPSFTYVNMPRNGFVANKYEYLEIGVEDPDANFSHLEITWGDGTVPFRTKDTAQALWHQYLAANDTLFRINIAIVDSNGAKKDTVIYTNVHMPILPIIDNQITYMPSQYLFPEDTLVTASVKVHKIEGWIAEVIWIINKNDTEKIFERAKYTEADGQVGADGKVLSFSFSAKNLKSTNLIEVIVIDRFQQQSSVAGSFYTTAQ
jgi:hypothetical protein